MSEPMPENVKKLFGIFKQAVEAEREAQEMYQRAIEVCDDEQTKEAMLVLFDDEVRHEAEIIQRYNELRRKFDVEED